MTDVSQDAREIVERLRRIRGTQFTPIENALVTEAADFIEAHLRSTIAARDSEPVAYLKRWWKDGRPCCRVDMSDSCEPWLDDLKPEIVPLYAIDTLTSAAQDKVETGSKCR